MAQSYWRLSVVTTTVVALVIAIAEMTPSPSKGIRLLSSESRTMTSAPLSYIFTGYSPVLLTTARTELLAAALMTVEVSVTSVVSDSASNGPTAADFIERTAFPVTFSKYLRDLYGLVGFPTSRLNIEDGLWLLDIA